MKNATTGKDLKKARLKWGLKQEELAEKWGMDRTEIVKAEAKESLTHCWRLLIIAFDKHGPNLM